MTKDIDALVAAADALDEALDAWALGGCPYCHGDCASANPPVAACPMRLTYEARKAYSAAREAVRKGTPPAYETSA